MRRRGQVTALALLAFAASLLLACRGGGDPSAARRLGLGDATALRGAGDGFCALAADAVSCWDGDGAPRAIAGLERPTALAMAERLACAVDRGGVACWQPGDAVATRWPGPPPLAIAPVLDQICALQGGELRCAYRATGAPAVAVAAPADATALHPVADREGVCAEAPGQLTCWGAYNRGDAVAFTESFRHALDAAPTVLESTPIRHLVLDGATLGVHYETDDRPFDAFRAVELLPLVERVGAAVQRGEETWLLRDGALHQVRHHAAGGPLALARDVGGRLDALWSAPPPHLYARAGDALVAVGTGSADAGKRWPVPGVVAPREVVVGRRQACALDRDGVACWPGPPARSP